MITTCPSREELQSFSLGQLAEEKSDELVFHLQSCDDCRSQMGTLEEVHDTFISQIRATQESATENESFTEEPELNLAAAKALAAFANHYEPKDAQDFPKTIGEYEVVRLIGRGGMGSVFLGKHTKLDRLVAIKFLADHRRWDHKMRQRFEEEMRLIGSIAHPNIVAAYDAREVDGQAVLVTEFIDGTNLSELIRRCGPLKIADACKITIEVCKALDYCQSKGLIHRDIKPSNIMITRSGNVKLLDLGLARLQTEDDRIEFTGTGQAVGTADYISPEQIQNSRDIDVRADIYSLGCTLFKMLTGHPPFPHPEFKNAFSKMNAHVSAEPANVATKRSNVPTSIDELVRKMLAKNPALRPASPSVVIDELQNLIRGNDLKLLVTQEHKNDCQVDAQISNVQPLARTRFNPIWPRRSWIFSLLMLGFGMFLGILITINNPDGTQTKLIVPKGSQVIIDNEGNAEIVLANANESVEIPKQDVQLPESATNPNSNRNFEVAISNTQSVYDQLIEGDYVDVLEGQTTFGEPHKMLAHKVYVTHVKEPVNNKQSIGLSVSKQVKDRILHDLEQANIEPVIFHHDPAIVASFHEMQMSGIWKFVLAKENGNLVDHYSGSALRAHRGRFMLADPSGNISVATMKVGEDQTLSFTRFDQHNPVESVCRYRFLENGILEIATTLDGKKLPSWATPELYWRLAPVKTPKTHSEKVLEKVVDAHEKDFEIFIKDVVSNERLTETLISNADIVRATAMPAEGDQQVIDLTFTSQGGFRLDAATQKHKGHVLVCVADGEEVCASRIQARVGKTCRLYTKLNAVELAGSIAPRLELDGKPIDKVTIIESSKKRIRELAIAIHNYADSYKKLPSTTGKIQGHPVSWRIKILPFLDGGKKLHEQYRFGEPWDSAHNQKLIAQMPCQFRHPLSPPDSTTTDYVGIMEEYSCLGIDQELTLSDTADGTSITTMLLESNSKIPWTKPEDLRVDEDGLKTVEPFCDLLVHATADAATHATPIENLTDRIFRSLVNRKDGAPLSHQEILSKFDFDFFPLGISNGIKLEETEVYPNRNSSNQFDRARR